MAQLIHVVKGMNDILSAETKIWRHIEKILVDCVAQYGYEEIRLPVLENTQLFKRTIGEVTDIVEKEMYTFQDLNGDSLTLRPEGTAGCVRACIEHGLLRNQSQKFWYYGPMYRHEKPQKGRYRQFTQFGIEAFGFADFTVEIELIILCQRLWQSLGINNLLTLEINTLGTVTERKIYQKKLVEFLYKNIEKLDVHSVSRLNTNPLRILDSKDHNVQQLLLDAPKIFDVLGDESKVKFTKLRDGLEKLGIKYFINPCLVRGLDYYEHTVFEWVTDKLGSQATVGAGGRYDKLVEHLGGNATPAVGLAIGMERVVLLTRLTDFTVINSNLKLFIISGSEQALQYSLNLAEKLRSANRSWQVIVHLVIGTSFKSQFKKADKSGADFAIIIGDNELELSQVCIKNLRHHEDQCLLSEQHLINYLLDNGST